MTDDSSEGPSPELVEFVKALARFAVARDFDRALKDARAARGQTIESTSPLTPQDDGRPYSVAQLAERWGCSGSVVRKLINQEELQFFRIGTLIRISAAEVQRYERAAAPTPITPPVEEAVQAAKPPRIIPRAARRRKPIVINRSKGEA